MIFSPRQTLGSPRGTILADLFLYSYESEFLQNHLKVKRRTNPTWFINFTFRYNDDVLSLYFPHFKEFLYLIYIPVNVRSALYFYLFLDINMNGQLRTRTFDAWTGFSIVNFPFLIHYITLCPSHGIYVCIKSNFIYSQASQQNTEILVMGYFKTLMMMKNNLFLHNISATVTINDLS